MTTPSPSRRLAAAALLLALAAGCAVNPVTGRSELHLVSEQEEIAMGRTNYVPGQQQSGGQYVVDAPLTAYVREVGQKLAQVSDRRQLPYEFVVLNESVPNAWAMPGGKIAVNRGLLTELKSEAELAAVIGHEIVHAAGRHAARGMESGLLIQAGAAVISAATADRQYGRVVDAVAGVGAGLLGVKYGRDLELEADHYGMIYMQRAGYDPQAAVSLQETFVRLAGNKEANWLAGLFASHPPSQERVDENRRFAATLGGNFKTGEKEYQARIAPLLKSRAAYKSFDEGEKALKNKDADKALQLADAALKIEPREALFYGLRGDAHSLLKKHKEAEADYSEAIKRNADFYEFYLGRGRERQQRGDFDAARADFDKANTLLPTAQAHYKLGQIRLARGDRGAAIEHFRAASSARSDAGKSAAVALARLDLPANPGRYLATAIEKDGRDQLVLLVRNNAPVAVGDIVVAATHSARGRESFRLGSLQPGETARIGLPWRVSDLRDGARVAGQILSAGSVE